MVGFQQRIINNIEKTGTLCYSVVVQILMLLETNNESHKGFYKQREKSSTRQLFFDKW